MTIKSLVFLYIMAFVLRCCIAYRFSTYVVMFPKTIRPGLDIEVYVNILEAANPTTVTVTLQDGKNNTITTTSKDNILVGSPDIIPLTVR